MKKTIQLLLNKFGYEIHNKARQQRNITDLKWQFLKNIKVKTIIDIGANEGQFVNEVIDIFPEAEIYSFEPLKDCYEKLILNSKKNERLHSFNLALGEEEGETIFCRSSASPSSSILKMSRLHKDLFPHTAKSVEEKVKIMRLDDVLTSEKLKDSVLLKIDVQGAEDRVINGAVEILKRVKVIITEVSYAPLYENQPLFKDIFNLLEMHSFIYIGTIEQFKNPLTNAPLFADGIFVKEGNLQCPL